MSDASNAISSVLVIIVILLLLVLPRDINLNPYNPPFNPPPSYFQQLYGQHIHQLSLKAINNRYITLWISGGQAGGYMHQENYTARLWVWIAVAPEPYGGNVQLAYSSTIVTFLLNRNDSLVWQAFNTTYKGYHSSSYDMTYTPPKEMYDFEYETNPYILNLVAGYTYMLKANVEQIINGTKSGVEQWILTLTVIGE